MVWLGIAVAGAGGAVARYLVDSAVASRTTGSYPWGTLVVNLSGAFLLGLVAGVVARMAAPAALGPVLGTGFCGAYTTFSTLVYESWRLAEDGSWWFAALNVATLLLGGVAAAAGWVAAGG